IPVLVGTSVGVSDDTSDVGHGAPFFSEGTRLTTGREKGESPDDSRVWVVRASVSVEDTVVAGSAGAQPGKWDPVAGGLDVSGDGNQDGEEFRCLSGGL
ncbi:hypothetical protein CSPAE12_06343, partial [Colletotrichum incanum]